MLKNDEFMCYSMFGRFSTLWMKGLNKEGKCVCNFFRSCRPEVFYKIGLLKNFVKFRGKHLWQSLFFNKVAAT